MSQANRRVLFDSQVFAEQVHGGVSKYFVELAQHLAVRNRWEPIIFGGIHIGALPAIPTAGPHLRLPKLPHSIRALRSLNRFLLGLSGKRLGRARGVFHPTWYDLPTIDRVVGPPLVVTVHDLIPESWPDVTTPLQLEYRRRCFERASRIICVSAATLDRLHSKYGGSIASKATVIHLGSPAPRKPEVRNALLMNRPYVLYVGKRGSYKDFGTLARAMARLPEGPDLVAVGGATPRRAELDKLTALHIDSRVLFRRSATENELRDLMAGATALVSTSREEGFGLPAMEALIEGTPVILTDIPVYREIYSRWARFFPPGDASSLASVISEIDDSPWKLDDLAPQPGTYYSWERAAELTEAVYGQAMGDRES
jgi:glycosyltransferase involved in cell wall biosynthesis